MTEIKLKSVLDSLFGTDAVFTQVSPRWPELHARSRYDFHIPHLNIFIELDGRQHFEQVANWKPPEQQRISDINKTRAALNHGQCLIRVLQADVAADRNDWLTRLTKAIANMTDADKPFVRFMTTDTQDEYAKHIEGWLDQGGRPLKRQRRAC